MNSRDAVVCLQGRETPKMSVSDLVSMVTTSRDAMATLCFAPAGRLSAAQIRQLVAHVDNIGDVQCVLNEVYNGELDLSAADLARLEKIAGEA